MIWGIQETHSFSSPFGASSRKGGVGDGTPSLECGAVGCKNPWISLSAVPDSL